MNFEQYTEASNRFLREVCGELQNNNDTAQAYRLTKAVFRTLRMMILPEESGHIIAQLPMLIKALYVDGWNLQQSGDRPQDIDEFLTCIYAEDKKTAAADFMDDQTTLQQVQAVFHTMYRYVSTGEMIHIADQLPSGIAILLQPVILSD